MPTADTSVARYDTQAPFGSVSSWATFDVSSLNANAKGFVGAAFDGKHIYLVPFYNGDYHGNVVRFDAKDPPGLPPGWNSSFF